MIKFKDILKEVNKADINYQIKNDYSGNTPPKITKLNKKEVSIWYGYKVNPKDVIKSFKQIHPHITMKHIKWSNVSTGGGVHTFRISESVTEEVDSKYLKKIATDLAYSMPNHTKYDDKKGPTDSQIMNAMKKYYKDLFQYSTSSQKKLAIKIVKNVLSEGKKEDAAVEKAIIAMVDSMIKAGKKPGEITKHLKSQVPYKITTNAIRKLINRPEIKPGEWLNEGVPMPTTSPNEFAYLDFKKWAYKKRGKIKKQMASLSPGNRERALVAVWEMWDKMKNKGAYSNIKDYKKFGKVLWNMMKKDRLIENSMKLSEIITIPVEVGDVVMGGKFKNKKITVKEIGTNEKGDITINGKSILRIRVLPKDKE